MPVKKKEKSQYKVLKGVNLKEGLFTKEIGKVFLKTNNQTLDYINKLKEILEKCPADLKEEIEKKILTVITGSSFVPSSSDSEE